MMEMAYRGQWILQSHFSLVMLSLSLIHAHTSSLNFNFYTYTTVGTADIIRDLDEPLISENSFSADLQFLPNYVAGTTLCLDFTVVDDDLIESIESFQGSLQPALTEFDSTMISNNSVYIADNDGKFKYVLTYEYEKSVLHSSLVSKPWYYTCIIEQGMN